MYLPSGEYAGLKLPPALVETFTGFADWLVRSRGHKSTCVEIAGTGSVDVENDSFTVHNPMAIGADTPMPVLVAALGPVMLQLAGELADGTVLWMADERAIGDHIAPKITKAAADAGRPAPRIVAGIPVCLCAPSQVDESKERANRILGEAEVSPNYQRLLERGDGTSACGG